MVKMCTVLQTHCNPEQAVRQTFSASASEEKQRRTSNNRWHLRNIWR